jgi:putative endonuclease
VAFVYVLRCADGFLYVGHTNDLLRRLQLHRRGIGGVSLLDRGAMSIVYAEEHPSDQAALVRERQIKGWSRAKKDALVTGDVGRLGRR